MAITRAQQAKQLLAQGGRIGFQGGGKDSSTIGTDNFKAREYSPSEKKDQQKTAELNQRIREGGDGANIVDEVALTGGTTKKTKTKDKDKSFIKDFLDKRQKFNYNLARKLPFATQSSFKNLTDYRNYLVSQGADTSTIDELMEGVDEDTPMSYENFQKLLNLQPSGITDKEVLKKALEATEFTDMPVTAVPQTFEEFMLTQKNNPNLFAKGDLGNFMTMTKPKDLVNPFTGELYTDIEFEKLKREIGQDRGLDRE